MRDLASRLRAIVQSNGGRPETPRGPDPGGARELAYVPDAADGAFDLDRVAEALGGSRHDVGGSACVSIDRRWESWQAHGRRRIETFAVEPDAPIGVLDARVAGVRDWARRIVFFDIETTGLSGGAGMIAFLAGCAWFEADGALTVRQFLVTGPAGERALLAGLERVFDEASLLVTYNGRAFDVPVMEMRWAFHRLSAPTDDLPHLDLLASARRIWGRPGAARGADWRLAPLRLREPGEPPNCTLGSLEQSVLGFHRLDDVPGLEIGSRYFQFLRTGSAAAIDGVLDHNRHDLVSLAAMASHTLWLVREGPGACRDAREQYGLGRLYERARQTDRAAAAYELAAGRGDRETRRHALARQAVLLRRDGRFDDAADAWAGVLALGDRRRPLDVLERRAAEALAIHHEHRARDPKVARGYAETLEADGRARSHTTTVRDAERRLARLDRKIGTVKETPRRRAPLLED